MLRAKFHVVSSLLSVILTLTYHAPSTPVQNECAQNRNYGKCFFLHNYAFTRRFDLYSIPNKALVAFWQEFHFKETGTKTEHFVQRGITELQHWTV